MENLKDLNLDRKLLENNLETVAKKILGDSVNIRKTAQKQSTLYTFSSTEKQCKLQFYYNKKGTITVNHKVGTDHGLSKTLAEELIGVSLIDQRKSFSITIADFNYFDDFISYMLEDDKSRQLEEKKEEIYLLTKLQGQQGDILTIKKYTNGTLQLQGKPILLYKDALYFLVELCGAENIIKAQEDFHEIQINKEGIDYEYESLLKNSSVFLGDTIKQIILPSFTLKKIDIELTDYSLFVFPVLKGLEGYIKQLFRSKGNIIKRDTIGEHFSLSHPDPIFRLKPEMKAQIGCSITCSVIEEAYNYLRIHRNPLFHIDGMIEPTKIIDTKIQAEKLIDETIDLIETTYSRLI
jgi:hypothetical protein